MFDDAAELTHQVDHRPWPLPHRPWIMKQRWNDLLFMHWPVATDIVRALVPHELELDRHDETAWISITPFYLSDLHPRGLPPIPRLSEFPELNVRTYVVADDKPGVYFFSLDAGSNLAVVGARALYHLPYFHATMRVRGTPNQSIDHESRRSQAGPAPALFSATYGPTGPIVRSERGSLDHWLSERYCLYTTDGGALYRAEIHHLPWPLQPAQIDLRQNTMAAAARIELPSVKPRLSFAKRLDVLIWANERIRDARGRRAA
jgi:uncharacterized protein